MSGQVPLDRDSPREIHEALKEFGAEFDNYDTNKDGKVLFEEVIAAIGPF